MTQHESRGASDAGEPAGMSEAERRERLTQLLLRRSELSPDKAALLHEVFPGIVAAHHDQVWNLLRKRGLDSHDAEVGAREPRPSTGRPAEHLTITSFALEIPAEILEQRGKLPFKPRAPGTELARTMQVPMLNPRNGETMPLGDDSISKAVAALPFAGSTVGAALVPFPQLPLEAYASFRAELPRWPERSAEILRRYHVMNEAACRALDEHWQIELTASPEARATFDKLLADFMAWLRTR